MSHNLRMNVARETKSKTDQLDCKFAALVHDCTVIEVPVAEMVADRLVNNAAMALSVINRPSVSNARSQALAHPNAIHPRSYGARLFGLSRECRVSVEWAAYANMVAINAPDYSDGFFAGDAAQPANTIVPILAVAQHCNRNGVDLLRGIVAACKIHAALTKACSFPDHGVHGATVLGTAAVVGIGACLALDAEMIYQAVQQVWLSREAGNGNESRFVWGAANTAKVAIEAVDRCMRGETTGYDDDESECGLKDALGGSADIQFDNGRTVSDELIFSATHSQGDRCYSRADCIEKFESITAGIVSSGERQRFLSAVQKLPHLASGELADLNVEADLIGVIHGQPDGRGIF